MNGSSTPQHEGDKDVAEMKRALEAKSPAKGLMVFPILFISAWLGFNAGYVNKALFILAGCMSITGLFLHMATQKYPNPRGESSTSLLERIFSSVVGVPTSNDESMTDLVTKFRLDANNIKKSQVLLLNLRKKLGKKVKAGENADLHAIEAVKLGLIKYALVFTQDRISTDVRIPIALDIVNTILSKKSAQKMLCHLNDGSALKESVDTILQAIQEHTKSDEELQKLVSLEEDQNSTKLDKGNKADDIEEPVDFDFSDKEKHIPNKHFLKFGSKLIMSLGMLAADEVIAQTRIGDQGGVGAIVKCLTNCMTSAQIIKWCCWTSINLVYEHPPNKREFFQKGGVGLVIDGLKSHPTDLELHQQGLALIITIIANDPNTKMNQSKARESCLANGIAIMLQQCRKQFAQQADINSLVKQINECLMSDWS